jgi:hypothetical protein
MKGLTEKNQRILRLHLVSPVGALIRYGTEDGSTGSGIKSQYLVVRFFFLF